MDAIDKDIALFSNPSTENLFVQGLLLTASNPLTIVFWSGMFSAQMIENKWNKTSYQKGQRRRNYGTSVIAFSRGLNNNLFNI